MAHHKFNYKSLEQLQMDIAERGVDIPLSTNIGVLNEALTIDSRMVLNRLAIHPMEGCDSNANGQPSELTKRRYHRFASGGAGLLWVEACAIKDEGKANPRQLSISKENAPALKEMLDEIKRDAKEANGPDFVPFTVLQLTHSGRYSRPVDVPRPIIAASNPYLDPFLKNTAHVITDEELEKLEDDYVKAAELAAEVGFDAIDIKACHRYLISELLSAFTREGKYGGSFENRTRFLLNIVEKIKTKLDGRITLAVRLNAFDEIPYPYGWGVSQDDFHVPDLSEPVRLAKLLEEKGVQLINVSIGNPYYNPHVGRPYDMGPYIPPFHPLEGIAKLLHIVRGIQAAVPNIAVMGTGFSWLREFAPYVAAGCVEAGWFKLAGFGRQAFAYPSFAHDILHEGKLTASKCCIACGKCSEIMRDGGMSGCVIKDPEVYVKLYREGRQDKPPLTGTHLAEHI